MSGKTVSLQRQSILTAVTVGADHEATERRPQSLTWAQRPAEEPAQPLKGLG